MKMTYVDILKIILEKAIKARPVVGEEDADTYENPHKRGMCLLFSETFYLLYKKGLVELSEGNKGEEWLDQSMACFTKDSEYMYPFLYSFIKTFNHNFTDDQVKEEWISMWTTKLKEDFGVEVGQNHV